MCNIPLVVFEHNDERINTIINSTHNIIVAKQKNVMPKYNLLNRTEIHKQTLKAIIDEIVYGIDYTSRILKRTTFRYELLECQEKYKKELKGILRQYGYSVFSARLKFSDNPEILCITIEW